ncbi:MAG: 2-(3-amino-3-carboxypropyl)histidine synthase subunit [Candidatus Nanoarchaeia archaeon]|nr:2-(3-amino-3-carboxypropyl)histidine synthase subunit [Candidatus Nanoarchaeia archaeon]MDD5239616.1 2-(3-amino-3-carboxypropyl)histidine synthase subunit [Candidatus Nanoarchaeia archaeon]
MKTLFIPAKYTKPLGSEFMKAIAAEIRQKNIGLFTTIQFIGQMKQLKQFLEKNGKNILVGHPDYKAVEPGQVLGCDVSAPKSIEDKCDIFLYLGSGKFHQLNLAVQTGKQIIQANPLTETVSAISKAEVEHFKKMRDETLKKAVSGKVYGILISAKPGQYNPLLAEKIKKRLESKGKTVYMFISDTISPDETYNFPQIDVWVNTACYRIGLDDAENYPKPLVNASDLLEYWNKDSKQ